MASDAAALSFYRIMASLASQVLPEKSCLPEIIPLWSPIRLYCSWKGARHVDTTIQHSLHAFGRTTLDGKAANSRSVGSPVTGHPSPS